MNAKPDACVRMDAFMHARMHAQAICTCRRRDVNQPHPLLRAASLDAMPALLEPNKLLPQLNQVVYQLRHQLRTCTVQRVAVVQRLQLGAQCRQVALRAQHLGTVARRAATACARCCPAGVWSSW
eukprot:365863-Chlamydomonas_euryale.AAC.5